MKTAKLRLTLVSVLLVAFVLSGTFLCCDFTAAETNNPTNYNY